MICRSSASASMASRTSRIVSRSLYAGMRNEIHTARRSATVTTRVVDALLPVRHRREDRQRRPGADDAPVTKAGSAGRELGGPRAPPLDGDENPPHFARLEAIA